MNHFTKNTGITQPTPTTSEIFSFYCHSSAICYGTENIVLILGKVSNNSLYKTHEFGGSANIFSRYKELSLRLTAAGALE